jgi:uncharacterized protein
MAKDHIGYEALADRALRSVVKEALKRTEKQGLIGPHHFYLTFRTKDPGVDMPDFLLEQFPEEMTIVLQNQFWGLKVREDEFEVGLTFRKMPTTLVIPFAALTAFVDPSVQFGLQFRPSGATKKAPTPQVVKETPVQKVPAAAKERLPETPSTERAAEQPAAESPAASQVVSIDKFRKK